ncbi:MAG: hypothetical protein AMS21_05160 [Gemmatimonas sp. SG8_38_2]|nr:MAG: hypothetical protein AMS21_05160 [Gemmatimonas sp. SG8_38_2]
MRTRLSNWTRFALPILVVGALACGDDDEGTGVTTADLAGNWSALTFVLSGNDFLPVDPIDVVGVLGVTVNLNVQTSGAFTFTTQGLNTATQGQLDDVNITGTITITGSNTAEVEADSDPGNPSEGTFTLSGDSMTLTLLDAAIIDFDDSGDIVPAEYVDINATMER